MLRARFNKFIKAG